MLLFQLSDNNDEDDDDDDGGTTIDKTSRWTGRRGGVGWLEPTVTSNGR